MLESAEQTHHLFDLQTRVLKDEIKKLEQEKSRQEEKIDMMYLKNIIFQMLMADEQDKLLPVIAALLNFSQDEMQQIQKKFAQRNRSMYFWSSS